MDNDGFLATHRPYYPLGFCVRVINMAEGGAKRWKRTTHIQRPEQTSAIYNMGLMTYERLNDLFSQITIYSVEAFLGNSKATLYYYSILRELYRILRPIINVADRPLVTDLITQASENIDIYRKKIKDHKKTINLLEKIEQTLYDLAQKKGMYIPVERMETDYQRLKNTISQVR